MYLIIRDSNLAKARSASCLRWWVRGCSIAPWPMYVGLICYSISGSGSAGSNRDDVKSWLSVALCADEWQLVISNCMRVIDVCVARLSSKSIRGPYQPLSDRGMCHSRPLTSHSWNGSLFNSTLLLCLLSCIASASGASKQSSNSRYFCRCDTLHVVQ